MVAVTVTRLRHRGGVRGWERRMSDASPAFQRIAAHLEDYFGRTFASEGAEQGRRWRPLSPRYSAAKARTHPGHPILTREGDLRNSLAERSAPGHFEQIGPRGLLYGTSVAHARAHQWGRGKLPARPFLRLNRRIVRVAVKEVARHLRG